MDFDRTQVFDRLRVQLARQLDQHRDTGAIDAVRHWPAGTRTGALV